MSWVDTSPCPVQLSESSPVQYAHTHTLPHPVNLSKHRDLSNHVKLWYHQFSRYQKENVKPQQCKMHVTSFPTTWAQRKSCTRLAEPLPERIAQLCNGHSWHNQNRGKKLKDENWSILDHVRILSPPNCTCWLRSHCTTVTHSLYWWWSLFSSRELSRYLAAYHRICTRRGHYNWSTHILGPKWFLLLGQSCPACGIYEQRADTAPSLLRQTFWVLRSCQHHH